MHTPGGVDPVHPAARTADGLSACPPPTEEDHAVPDSYYRSPWDEVPVLPVVVPLGVLVLAFLLWRLHRRAAITAPRVAVAVVVSVYVAGVVANSLFPVFLGKPGGGTAWWEVPYLTPVVGYEVRDLVENVAVFVPLGFLLPLLVARATSLPRVVVSGFLISLTIELLQWVNAVTVQGGHAPDVNDLLSNTLGTPLGYGLYRLALLLPVLGGLTRAAAWPGASEPPAARPGEPAQPGGRW
jgi:hypothetical protein